MIVPGNRDIVAGEFLAVQRDAELVIGKCSHLREELRQISENQGSGFAVDASLVA